MLKATGMSSRKGAKKRKTKGVECFFFLFGSSVLCAFARNRNFAFYLFTLAFFSLPFTLVSCTLSASRGGIPPEAQSAIDNLTREIDAGNYDKIYKEAAEEWRHRATPEESKAFFETLKTKLGNVKSRAYHTAAEQHNTGGPIPGHSFVITYRTTFDRAEGMETITLLEREGRWLLAGYFVNSDALK